MSPARRPEPLLLVSDRAGDRGAERNRVARILIIAGPNGAGKTTFASEFLPNEGRCPIFVNAEVAAAELSPEAP